MCRGRRPAATRPRPVWRRPVRVCLAPRSLQPGQPPVVVSPFLTPCPAARARAQPRRARPLDPRPAPLLFVSRVPARARPRHTQPPRAVAARAAASSRAVRRGVDACPRRVPTPRAAAVGRIRPPTPQEAHCILRRRQAFISRRQERRCARARARPLPAAQTHTIVARSTTTLTAVWGRRRLRRCLGFGQAAACARARGTWASLLLAGLALACRAAAPWPPRGALY